jgi:hypothetical protein
MVQSEVAVAEVVKPRLGLRLLVAQVVLEQIIHLIQGALLGAAAAAAVLVAGLYQLMLAAQGALAVYMVPVAAAVPRRARGVRPLVQPVVPVRKAL